MMFVSRLSNELVSTVVVTDERPVGSRVPDARRRRRLLAGPPPPAATVTSLKNTKAEQIAKRYNCRVFRIIHY